MSTKRTIVHGKNFHFYSEVFDEENVYLELNNLPYETWSNHRCSPPVYTVVVTVPLSIWEVIRPQTTASFDWVDQTDQEILLFATESVDRDIAAYQNASDEDRDLIRFADADEPREQRINELVAYYTQLRDCQQNLRDAIEQLHKLNRISERINANPASPT